VTGANGIDARKKRYFELERKDEMNTRKIAIFAAILVLMFGVSMGTLMLVRLRQKLWICAPIALFALSFAVCLFVFSLMAKTEIRYAGKGSDEVILADRAGKISVCDITDASAGDHMFIYDTLTPYSVEIENYVIASLEDGHAQMLERICQNMIIRSVYVPISADIKELRAANEVRKIAEKYGTRTVYYQSGDRVELLRGLLLLPYFEVEDGEVTNLYMTFFDRESFLSYTDAAQSQGGFVAGSQSRYFLLGKHGTPRKDIVTQEYDFSSTELIFADKGVLNFAYDVNGYVLESKERKRSLTLICDTE